MEKELGIELVGDIKVKIEANEEEDPWDDIVEEGEERVEPVAEGIDYSSSNIDGVKEEFIEDTI